MLGKKILFGAVVCSDALLSTSELLSRVYVAAVVVRW